MTPLLGISLLMGGCQWLRDFEERRQLDTARAEHTACVERGYDFPGEAYVECRLDLHDKRLRDQWSELEMSRQQQATMEPGNLPRQGHEVYRPLQLEDYRCEMRQDAEGQPWIHCFEDTGS